MTQEDKLKEAKRLYQTANADQKYVLESLFPELTESEDERIRKGIIRNLEYLIDKAEGFVKDELKERIAWLEKQYADPIKEYWRGYNESKQNVLDKYAELEKQGKTFTKKDVDDAYLKGVCDAKQEIEKQGKQKLVDKVEPKFKVKYAGSEYNVFETKDIAGVTFYGIEDEPNHIDYVKADNCEIISGYGIKESGLSFPTKPVMFSEQETAWGEEDEVELNGLIKHYEDGHVSTPQNRKTINWLKSLKERVQPQNTRKPSDEHYELEEFAKIVRGNLTGISKAVQELFEAKYLQLTGNKMYGEYKD